MRAALALGCVVEAESRFDRKHYQYGDLPAGYQITQQDRPFARHGHVELAGRRVHIERMQLEQDSAKTVWLPSGRRAFDLNRCGVALVEIVTGPEMRSAAEAVQVAQHIWQTLKDVGACGGALEAGQMRFDANVSVTGPNAHPEDPPLGVRVEIKNINTFRGLAKAIEEEARRQMAALDRGERIQRETRAFDEDRGQSRTSRPKEAQASYGFIPDGDLPPLIISEEWVQRIRESLPATRASQRARLQERYNLSDGQGEMLLEEPQLHSLFEQCCQRASPPVAFNFVTNIYPSVLARRGLCLASGPLSGEALARLAGLLSDQAIDSRPLRVQGNGALSHPTS